MKYSFMSFSCPELTLAEMLALAERLGYDGIEPRIEAGHKHGIEMGTSPEERRAFAQVAADSPIELCCVATSRQFADPATTEQQVQDTLRCIDLAADIGSPRLRVFGGPIAEGVDRQQAIDLLTECFQAVADRARQRGVTLCVETHDDWCNPNHLSQVMQNVSHPAIAVNWDVMHPVRAAKWTVDASFETLQPWIRHLHVHDGTADLQKLQLLPMGQGEIDHRRAIELLQTISYDGFLSGEWINWEPYGTHLPRELRAMKQYESETA